jgi:hypothetical protein
MIRRAVPLRGCDEFTVTARWLCIRDAVLLWEAHAEAEPAAAGPG